MSGPRNPTRLMRRTKSKSRARRTRSHDRDVWPQLPAYFVNVSRKMSCAPRSHWLAASTPFGFACSCFARRFPCARVFVPSFSVDFGADILDRNAISLPASARQRRWLGFATRSATISWTRYMKSGRGASRVFAFRRVDCSTLRENAGWPTHMAAQPRFSENDVGCLERRDCAVRP